MLQLLESVHSIIKSFGKSSLRRYTNLVRELVTLPEFLPPRFNAA